MFIEEYPNLVPRTLCEEIIAKFEQDPRKKPSTVGNLGQSSERRTGTLLRLGEEIREWRAIVDAVFPAVQRALSLYAEKYESIRIAIDEDGLVCKFPLIERVDPGQAFDWHYDQNSDNPERVVAVLLYLRDITAGGSTEFMFQRKRIQPRAGKIALFPPYWTHFHRGITPASESKYVMSFFWVTAASQNQKAPVKAGFLKRMLG